MPTKFFKRPSRQLRHHTVSLLPEAERIIRIDEMHFAETITRATGDIANFSISLNLITLNRLAVLCTAIRKNQPLDPDALQFVFDIIDNKRKVTDQDLADYKKALTSITQRYKKSHPDISR